MAKNPAHWIPNSIESTCLGHLDHEEAWTQFLRRDRPSEDEILAWNVFLRIFWFNFVLFAIVIGILFLALEYAQGGGAAGVREDAIFGAILSILGSASMAGYSTFLYRRTWNRRARKLLAEQ